MVGAPVSPELASMRDYTLTPEKEEVPEIDEDEPLNLSTRPRSPTPNTPSSASNANNSAASTSHHNLSRSHALIWSPASICENESSADTRRPTRIKHEHTDSLPRLHTSLGSHEFSAVAAAAAAAAAAAVSSPRHHLLTESSSSSSSSSSLSSNR